MAADLDVLVELGSTADRSLGDVVAGSVVQEHHVESGGRGTLLAVAGDGDALSGDTAEEERAELLRVAVVVEVDVLVGGEERVPVDVLERVWVAAGGREDHEVGDVHDTDAERWRDLAEESGGGDNLEGHLNTETDENDVGVDTLIGGAELPGGSSGDAVLKAEVSVEIVRGRDDCAYPVGLLGGEPHGRGLLAADHEVDVVLGPQAVRHRAQEAVGIGRQVHARELGLEVEDGADERRVLVRETVVLLPRPGGGLEVVEGSARLAPWGLVRLRNQVSDRKLRAREAKLTILTNLQYCTIMVSMMPRNASYEGKRPVRPVRV